jgi:hypothetical protein
MPAIGCWTSTAPSAKQCCRERHSWSWPGRRWTPRPPVGRSDSDVYFLVPLVFKDGETKEIRTILSKRDDGFAFVVVSRVEADADE